MKEWSKPTLTRIRRRSWIWRDCPECGGEHPQQIKILHHSGVWWSRNPLTGTDRNLDCKSHFRNDPMRLWCDGCAASHWFNLAAEGRA